MKEYTFTPDELLGLTELCDDALAIDRKIKRRVGHIAGVNGIDPSKHDIKYDLTKGKIFYEPAQEPAPKD